MSLDRTYIECSCGYQEHALVLVVDKVNDEDRKLGFPDSVILGYQLPRVPFFYRLKYAIGYIFGFNPISHWSDMIIEQDKAKKMVSVLNEIIEP